MKKKYIYPLLKSIDINFFYIRIEIMSKSHKKQITVFYKSALKARVVSKHVNIVNVWLPAAVLNVLSICRKQGKKTEELTLIRSYCQYFRNSKTDLQHCNNFFSYNL